LMIYTFANSC